MNTLCLKLAVDCKYILIQHSWSRIAGYSLSCGDGGWPCGAIIRVMGADILCAINWQSARENDPCMQP